MSDWDDVKRLRAQADALFRIIHDRIVEGVGRLQRRVDTTPLVPWVETSGDDVHIKNVRNDWTQVEVDELRLLVRSFGFRSLHAYDTTGKWVFTA